MLENGISRSGEYIMKNFLSGDYCAAMIGNVSEEAIKK